MIQYSFLDIEEHRTNTPESMTRGFLVAAKRQSPVPFQSTTQILSIRLKI